MAVSGSQAACLTRLAGCLSAETGKPPVLQLLQRKFDSFLRLAWNEVVSLNDAHARIPAQNSVVVTRRAKRFGLFKPTHRFSQEVIRLEIGSPVYSAAVSSSRDVPPQFLHNTPGRNPI